MTDTRAINGRRRRYAAIHAGALTVAIASGTFALVAMLVGSPQSFGLALALCGAGWIAAHFVERLAEQDRAAENRRRTALLRRVESRRRPVTRRRTISLA